MKIMRSGYEIEAHRKSFSYPAYVSVHKLGTEARSWFTPTEAREIAAILTDAAKRAEEES